MLLIQLVAICICLEKTSMRILLLLVVVFGFFNGNYQILKSKTSWVKLSTTILWLIPFVQLFLISSLVEYWPKLETKLSLILLPLIILIALDLKKEILQQLLKLFLIGSILSCIICTINGIFSFFISGNYNSFFYQELSIFHHPSYFSMYLNFSIGLLYINFIKPIKNFNINRKLSLLLIIFLTLIIVLVSSKNGWVTNILLHLFFSIIILKNEKFNIKHLSIISLIIISFISIKQIPSLNWRAQEFTKNFTSSSANSTSSTSARLIAWKSSFELIKNKPLVGYGTGLSKIELNKIYLDKGHSSILNINAHNQFIQFQLDHGIIGTICLLFFTIIMFVFTLFSRDYLYTLFLAIIIINFITESILQTQSGITFFAFFNTLFFYNWVNSKSINH